MVANLGVTNGRTSLFYAGDAPWHGLGTKVEGALTAQDAIVAAGLDWTVDPEAVFDRAGAEIERFHALRRSDTRDVLHVARSTYRPIQNREAFRFVDDVVSSGAAKYVTAGALGRGERIWVLAEIQRCDIRVLGGDDLVKPYLLFANAHDGSLAGWILATAIRCVCQNTLTAALDRRYQEGFRILHREGAVKRFKDAREALGIAIKYYDGLGEKINALASRQVTHEALREYHETLVPDNPKAENHTRTQKIRQTLVELFESGRGQDLAGARGTWWGAVNGVTEWVDHGRTVRGAETPEERQTKRVATILFGNGAALKRQAFEVALDLAGVKAE